MFADQSGFYLLPATVRTYALSDRLPSSTNSSRAITSR
jgi:hypothetical protein